MVNVYLHVRIKGNCIYLSLKCRVSHIMYYPGPLILEFRTHKYVSAIYQ